MHSRAFCSSSRARLFVFAGEFVRHRERSAAISLLAWREIVSVADAPSQ